MKCVLLRAKGGVYALALFGGVSFLIPDFLTAGRA
jgi:hypothetical protein